MAFERFTELLGSLLYKICGGDDKLLAETFGRLPNCLIIDILSRLPIDTLVRCRRDCKDLRALILSSYFTTLHLSRSANSRPMLLLHDFYGTDKQGRQLYLLFENHNKEDKGLNKLYLRPELMINKHKGQRTPGLIYSCQGVLLFIDYMRPPTTYYVLNPITQEEVIVHHTLQQSALCALYFCPLTNEFKLLHAQLQGSTCCQYLVYIFKTRTWRKIRSSTFKFLPYGSPTVVNGALHWITFTDLENMRTPPCANGIMVFRMDKEELATMPHPGSVCNAKQVHKTMTLLVKENCLAFCHLLVSEDAVDIWILEDYDMWAWNKRYRVDLLDWRNFPFSLPFSKQERIDMYWWIRLLYIQDGELLFYMSGRGLFIYNLDHKTVKRIELPMMIYAFGTYIKSLLAIA